MSLLLIHGAGGSIEDNYGPIMEGLTARHAVAALDLPGSGTTPAASAPLTLDDLADRYLAAADARGLGTFAVSGYSLGGPIAIRLAARHPERVTRLVLTATFSHADTRTDLAASIWHRLYATGQHDLLVQYLNLLALSEPALNSLTPAQLQAAVTQAVPSIPAGTPDQVDLVRRADVRADLAAITIPALVIVTTEDGLISPALQRDLAAALPQAEVADLATGHLPFAERPEEWLKLITDFLA
ncbi:alpha/beta fold hydrolase [Nonomuraea sp. NPDC050328]|uniref:alpha/beta fold hydrolase n=1 Tax=Nonomuraea sp. NPDC050328 TaxID=3364361 RepID=UPI003788AE9A